MMMFERCAFVAAFLCCMAVAAAGLDQPVCSAEDPNCAAAQPVLEADAAETRNDEECSIYYVDATDWLYAGKDVERGQDAIDWQDAVIHFTQHDRRAWPMWARYTTLHQVPNRPYEFIFAPAVHSWTSRHDRVANLQSMDGDLIATAPKTQTERKTQVAVNPPVKASRRIQKYDPLFYPTLIPEFAVEVDVRDLPKNNSHFVEKNGVCMSHLATGPSTVNGVDRGLFVKKNFAQGKAITSTTVLHFHRSEFYNETGDYHEELLNYCYGHERSDLLLLPYGPLLSTINHASAPHTANVKLDWNEHPLVLEQIFSSNGSWSNFQQEEIPIVSFLLTATRPIEAGEELLIDYGSTWETAWKNHQQLVQEGQNPKPFRHEIGLDIFPEQWLSKQVRNAPFPTMDTTKLKPGEIKAAVLQDGRTIDGEMYRIGLPEGLSYKMGKWAEDMGIAEMMEEWLNPDRYMAVGAEQRVRINGGNWWLRRFEKEWESNLFYICPDDDESNEQFMHALGEAGWDTVLEALGREADLDSLSMFYPSFIAMTHSQTAFMHSDSDNHEIFNLIFPVTQSNATNSAGVREAEVVVGSDPVNVPYTYEPDHVIALGKDGMHGTAPGDFRGTGHFRMVVSVYMGDFQDDEMLDEYIRGWQDPPYPRPWNLRRALKERIHWDRHDPTIKSQSPQKNFL